MKKEIKRASTVAKERVRKAAEGIENEVLITEGKRSIARKARIVKKVTKRAARVGLVVGTLAAVAVVVRDVRKRRKMDA